MSDPAKLVAVPVNENIPPSDKMAAPDAARNEPQPALVRQRSGRWLPPFWTVLALIAALVALAAPGLRPRIAASADAWLGSGNVVSRYLTAGQDAAWRQKLDARLDGFDVRFDKLASAQETVVADVTRTRAEAREDRETGSRLARAVDDLSRQTRELTEAVDGRTRATGLLALTLRLRRDVDAGMPIDGDLAALATAAPFPPAVDKALQQLHDVSGGTPTMHDLGDELDRLIARLAARSQADGSWATRSWNRVTQLFGGGEPSGDTRLLARLRMLAINGRFSEAASEIMASDDADLGMAWASRVQSRVTAVVAAQALLSYALAAYENAFSTTSTQ